MKCAKFAWKLQVVQWINVVFSRKILFAEHNKSLHAVPPWGKIFLVQYFFTELSMQILVENYMQSNFNVFLGKYFVAEQNA